MDDSRRVSSERVGPTDPRYRDLTRRGVNKAYVGAPDYVRLVASTKQVVEAVQDAIREGARIGIRSGGYCLEGFVDDPAVRALIDTSAMTGVHHDPGAARSPSRPAPPWPSLPPAPPRLGSAPTGWPVPGASSRVSHPEVQWCQEPSARSAFLRVPRFRAGPSANIAA